MAMRLTGLMSGMDTESIIQQLVEAKRTKVDSAKKAQTKLGWKMEAWKELNTKIKKLYNGTLSNLRFQGNFAKKTTRVSNSSFVDIVTSDSAMDSVQSLKITKMAKQGYLTGGEVKKENGNKCTTATKLTDMGIEVGSKIEVNTNGKTTEIEVTEGMTISNLVTKLNNAGVKANFDSTTQRFFIGASGSGEKADFTITANNAEGTNALDKLGILVYDDNAKAQYEYYAGLRSDEATYQKLVDKEVAKRLASYKSQVDSLNKSIESEEKYQEKLRNMFADDYADESFDDLLSNKDGALDTLKARIEALTAKSEEEEGLTEDEQAELAKLQDQLEYVEYYQNSEERVTQAKADIKDIEDTYFEVTGSDDDGNDIIAASQKLKDDVSAWLDNKIENAEEVLASGLKTSEGATKTAGQSAEIYLNGAKFTSESNTFEINGLTITCRAETGDEELTLTTENDTSGIYNMVKNFIKEYSALINEMDKLYNADSAKDYEPLTDEEKEEMSETEIEKWEEKIKDSLLRRDSTLSTVSSAFKTIMSSGFSVGGKTMYLSDFGIETLGYFEAEDNEKNAYHILGDEDDEYKSGETNKLMAMIQSNPNAVVDFFTQLSKSLYEKTTDLMKSVDGYSSAFTVYDDKKMQSDYDDYNSKIKKLEDKLTAYEDKWYSKFSKMETAMAKMQSNASAITSLLGG